MRKFVAVLVFLAFTAPCGCSSGTAPAERTAPPQIKTTTPAPSGSFTASSAVVSAVPTPAQPWQAMADMPTARFELRAAALGDKIYVIGGSDGNGRLSAVEVYDTVAGAWSEAADIPENLDCIGAVSTGGRVYAFLREQAFDAKAGVYEYDPGVDRWAKVSEMTTSRSNLGFAVLDGNIYAVGGLVNNDATGSFTNVSTVEAFDPATHEWTGKAGLPTAKHAVAVSAINGKIYAIGGSVTQGSGDFPSQTVEEYDPAADTWSARADMQLKSAYHCAVAVGGRIYVTGGLLKQYLFVYDPAADKWGLADSRGVKSWQNTAAEADGKLYVAGGTASTGDNWKPLNAFERYDPALDRD